jgi:uroporphyrinogen-III synthase
VVERAKGILQRELHISEEEAYLSLRKQSRQRRMPMKEIAAAIVLSDEVQRGRSPVANARDIRGDVSRGRPNGISAS